MTSTTYTTYLAPSRRFTPAFSLIEVVMAIAVVAFALVAIASTLPVGLKSMRDSQNDQAIGTIANQTRGALQQISFGTGAGSLSALTTSNYYYTVEGVQTVATSTTMLPYYRAQFTVKDAGVNGLPFGGTVSNPTNAATVTVILTYPYPALTQTNTFSLFAAKQTGF
jgi:uncharacterized protein (TIGR02598 family)